MTKEQFLSLRDELKELAIQLRSAKADRKSKQRDFSTIDTAYEDYFNKKYSSQEWEEVQPRYAQLYKLQDNARQTVEDLKLDYRVKHIVYSMAKGRTIDQIEKQVDQEDEQKKWARNKAYEKARVMCKMMVVEPLFERVA